MASYKIPLLPLPYDLETKTVLRQANKANRKLAELKGVAQTIPNERILIICFAVWNRPRRKPLRLLRI
jgi:hypothetical protein